MTYTGEIETPMESLLADCNCGPRFEALINGSTVVSIWHHSNCYHEFWQLEIYVLEPVWLSDNAIEMTIDTWRSTHWFKSFADAFGVVQYLVKDVAV